MSSGRDPRQSSDSEQIVGFAEQVDMHLHPCAPLQRVWRRPPTVFIQPEASTICDVD
jgi:hypothetical protein